MAFLIAVILTAFRLFAEATELDSCRISQPIPLPTQSDQWILKRPKFYPLFTTGSLVENYNERPMVLDLFRVRSNGEITPWLGVVLRREDRKPWWSWVGFTSNYSANMYVDGKAERTQKGFRYYTFAGSRKPSDPFSMYNEVEMLIENNHIVVLKLTIPVTLPCRVEGRNAWCDWTGQHETSCLVSGSFVR